ncbi:grpE protein homolog 1, mitochondrial [Chiloscyllium plagiosum]|uniref:grpE protein homolog 1, mitochondrial n=1 Tax=Chiloscyllium plagiosum TaxID=36176 RepID=UPI001CB88128|nr:grpE protein homolog 1, mitochondrial [Chiloscyllium plagiosum]
MAMAERGARVLRAGGRLALTLRPCPGRDRGLALSAAVTACPGRDRGLALSAAVRACSGWNGSGFAVHRFFCTATRQKNTGQSYDDDQSQTQNADKAEPSPAEKILVEEKNKLDEQLKDLTDKYKRALADAENIRQRSQKLVEEAKLYGIQGFCKDLLEVADILEKATESVPKEEISGQNPHLKSLYEGLIMTEGQLQKVFCKHGLIKLNPLGARFDPYEHEALFHTPVEGKEPGSVALVTKIGYKLHGRTLRPALVGVVKGTE